MRGDTWTIQLGAGCSARVELAPTGEPDGVLDAVIQIRGPSKRVSREVRLLWRPVYIRQCDTEIRRICEQVVKAGGPEPIGPYADPGLPVLAELAS